MTVHDQCVHPDRWDEVRASLCRIEDEMRSGFARVEAQQRITNGRVTRLEMCLLVVAGVVVGASLVAGVKASKIESIANAALDAAGVVIRSSVAK